MTKAQKIGIGVAAAAVVALLGAFALRHGEVQAPTEDEILTTSPNDTSDQALENDAAAIDAQLSGLATDTATIDQSISAGAQ
jgi:hypothetical protein